MPSVKPGEKEDAFVERCIPIVIQEGTAEDGKQGAAICHSMWRDAQRKKDMTNVNDTLLQSIRSRQQKQTEFAYGIMTADKYVTTLKDVAGIDACWRFASKGNVSFQDVLEKAAKTLVYSNPDMELEEKLTDQYGRAKNGRMPSGLELPKNTLMVFSHILTSSRKDRDGDVLHSEGMECDPKMLLLWQHVHTLPIGKMLAELEKNTKRIRLISCIVDLNETSHDSAVMIDNGMGRFSHGFRALEFDKVKASDVDDKAKEEREGGFEIKRGEIMEESLVSVPANVDADTEEVLLSLVEGGKLTSPILKEVSKGIRDRRALSLPVKLDLKVTVNGQEVKGYEDKSTSGRGTGKEGTGETSPSKEADGDKDKGSPEDKAGNEEGVIMVCSECEYKGKPDAKGMCPECGAEMIEEEEKEKEEEEKAGKEDKADKVDKPLFKPRTDEGAEGKPETCPECGSTNIEDGVCQECGETVGGKEKPKTKPKEEPKKEEKPKKSMDGEKAGRVLSKANENHIKEAKDHVDEASKMEGITRPCRAMLEKASRNLATVLSSLGEGDMNEEKVEKAMSILLLATRREREKMMNLLKTLAKQDDGQRRAEHFRSIVGR